MAVLRQGILGSCEGKVAGVVGARWKDKNYVRGYSIPANPNTAAQQTQRALMATAVYWAKLLVGPVLNVYWDPFVRSMSGFNFWIKTNILKMTTPPDWPNVYMCGGPLWPALIVSATYSDVTDDVTIVFNTANGSNGAATDKIFALVVNGTGLQVYFCAATVNRSVGTIVVPAATGLVAANLKAYIFASQYVGTVLHSVSLSQYHQCV
jgi:hypothetical protein